MKTGKPKGGWQFGLVFATVALAFVFISVSRRAGLIVPEPKDPTQLEPQLRAFVFQQIARVKEHPRDPERHALLGLTYAVNNLWPEAERAFTNAVTLAPNDPLAQMYVGVSAQEQGETDRAAKIYREVTEKFPSFPQAWSRLGELALKQGDTAEAEKAFTNLARLAPKEWRGWAGLGELALSRHKEKEAEGFLQKAVNLDPTARKAHFLLGKVYQGLGRTNEAQIEIAIGQNHADFPMADPWNEQAPQLMKTVADQIEIAQEMERHGANAEAVRLLLKASKFQPTNLTVLNNLAVAYLRDDKPEDSLKVLNKLEGGGSNYLPAKVTLSQTYQALGRTNEALQVAEELIRASPQLVDGYVAKASAFIGMEKDREALAQLQKAASLDPSRAEIQLQMGDVLWRNLGEGPSALECYKKAIASNPADPTAYIRLEELLNALGREVEAKTAFGMAQKLGRVQGINLDAKEQQ